MTSPSRSHTQTTGHPASLPAITGQPVTDSQADTQSSESDGRPPAPAVPTITVTTRTVRTYNGITVTLDGDLSDAVVDVGRVKSWDAVSALPRIANAVVECVQVAIVGEDAHTLNFVATELPKALQCAEPWVAGDFDDRRGAA